MLPYPLLLVLFLVRGSYPAQFVRNFEQANVDTSTKNNSTFKTVCYYPLDNVIDPDKMPYGLNPNLCSHLTFIPTLVDSQSRIKVTTPSHEKLFQKVIPVLKKANPKLKILVSNCGGPFDPVLKSEHNTYMFINSSIVFMRKYGFDGIDIDWEFPGWPTWQRPQAQIHNFSLLLLKMRKSFDSEAKNTKNSKLLLSVAVSGWNELRKVYEFDYFNRAVDYVSIMGYDFNSWGIFSPLTAYNSPLFPESYDKYAFFTNNLAWSANYWGSNIGKEKVVVGMPFYSHAYKLLTSWMHGYHSIAIGKGECDYEGYSCSCQAIKQKNATRVFDNAAKVPYIYYGDQWVSYEDPQSISIKTKWILDNGFAGIMVWHMKADDVTGVCNGTKYPLMKTVLNVINMYKNYGHQNIH